MNAHICQISPLLEAPKSYTLSTPTSPGNSGKQTHAKLVQLCLHLSRTLYIPTTMVLWAPPTRSPMDEADALTHHLRVPGAGRRRGDGPIQELGASAVSHAL